MPRVPVPPELRGVAIHTSSAGGYGLTRGRLRGPDVQHPFRGVAAFNLDLAALSARCRAFLPAMEFGQVFTHVTALALHGVPLPATAADLHVSVAFPRTPPRRPGIRGHSLSELPVRMLGPFPTSPITTAWAQSSTVLTREDLTAVGDHLLLSGIPASVLAEVAAGWSRRPGARRVTWAAEHARPGVRSRPETHLRLLVVGAGLPEPVVAHPVVTRPGLILHPDLAFPAHRLALEYEGDVHRQRREWERDIERRELLAEVGWRTIRVTADALSRSPTVLVARIRRHLDA